MTVATIRLGFTGTRHGMNALQLPCLSALLPRILIAEAHHGDCVGADAQFHHEILTTTTAPIVIRPPLSKVRRAFCKGAEDRVSVLPPRHYLERNNEIVACSDLLIAAPYTSFREAGGTWYTIRQARRKGVPLFILWPGGMVEADGELAKSLMPSG